MYCWHHLVLCNNTVFKWIIPNERRGKWSQHILSVIKFCFSIIENTPTISGNPAKMLLFCSFWWIISIKLDYELWGNDLFDFNVNEIPNFPTLTHAWPWNRKKIQGTRRGFFPILINLDGTNPFIAAHSKCRLIGTCQPIHSSHVDVNANSLIESLRTGASVLNFIAYNSRIRTPFEFNRNRIYGMTIRWVLYRNLKLLRWHHLFFIAFLSLVSFTNNASLMSYLFEMTSCGKFLFPSIELYLLWINVGYSNKMISFRAINKPIDQIKN